MDICIFNADEEKCIKEPYQMVSISYFPTSVERLYRINELQADGTYTEGEWKHYEDKAIWVNVGDKIEGKGIDKYGKETRITSSYISAVSDALGKETMDEDTSTYSVNSNGSKKIYIDSSLWGKKVNISVYAYTAYSDYCNKMILYNSANEELPGEINFRSNQLSQNLNRNIDIAEGTKYIDFWSDNNENYYIQVKELSVVNE